MDSSEIIFTDKKGKEHTLTKEVQEQWLETFNLKSLDESYTPKLPQELADTLGKEIRLTKGSLYKIVEKGREQYIPQIKETLEKPQIVLQDESELIFAKQIKDDLYLTSIGKDFDTHITIISNSPKTDKTIQSKLKNGKMIYKAENAEALPTSGAFTETNQVPFSNNTIPQKPKNSEPEKVLEYFRDDLIRGYNKALEAFEGKRPLVSTIPYKTLDTIIEAKTALVKEANDGFKKILQKAGFPDDVIQEKFMKSLNFGDIDYNLRRIREYFGQVEKNLHQYYETHKPIVEKLLKQKDEAIRLYESRLPDEQELHKKRILLSRFMENARVYGSKEHKLLDNFIDEIQAKKGLESTPSNLSTKKSLFDEVETSVESQATHQDYNTFNQSLKDAHDFFKANNKDPYNDKLFNDVIKVANALDIRFWYQPNAVWLGGSYTYTLNRIMLRSKDFSAENAKTMLHELIHSVTSRAIYAYENKALRAKLSKEQIEAITELKNLYKEVSENNADKVWKTMATFRDEVENNKGKLYGLKNEHEMLAELANPTFREFLKEQNIFSKIVEAMAKIFSYVKDKLTGESVKSTNAQSELESILYKIMDSYTNPHAFTNEMSEHFGSRNFVDTTRYKEYIKDHKEKFDKDNYKGKHLFSFFDDSMDFYTKTAISGRETFFKGFIDNAYFDKKFDKKDFKIAQQLKWQMIDQQYKSKSPTNLMELKTEKNAHIFQYIEQALENNIKDFVKEYYGVSYEEFNNAFNGAMKDKHFYEAKQFTYKNYEDNIPSKETAFLLALKPYFTSGLYKTLSEADFNVIKDNLYRILQDENLTYRNKPINEWLAKEWVEQDVKALQESFLYKLEQPQAQIESAQESLDINKNRIYSVELELTPRFSDSSTPLNTRISESGFNSQKGHQEQTIKAEPSIAKTDEQIVAQDSNALLESTMQKFNYDERKAKDLLEWHKDSSPLTKDENGVPKVFYHGTSADELFEVFSPKKDSTKWGFWFASGEDYADHYGKGKYGTRQEPLKFSTFLKVKNPFDMTDDKNLEVLKKIMGKKEYEAAAKEVDFDHDNGASKIYRILSYSPFDRYKYKARAFQNKLKKLGYDGIKEQDGVMIVFEPNQIKHIENRGVAGRYFYSSSPNIFHSNPHAGAGLLGGSVAGIEQDENGNITFNPEKFALGLLGSTGASIGISKTIKRASGKYAIMSRMEAKKHNKKLYNVFKAIDSSAKYGSKMNLIGKENLNADTLAYALARNKRFAINKLDEKTAKEMGFKYPHDVRRSIDPNNVAHTLNRHGEQSNLVQFSGQKPVTLDEIAKYQDYADNATHKGISIGKRQETANISARQLDGEFYVVVEQIQKGQNELGFKTMYFERGILDDEKFNKLLKK